MEMAIAIFYCDANKLFSEMFPFHFLITAIET